MISAAIEVIDTDGLRACTMRSVAGRLGVEPMSLYWHVTNKDDLLDGVIAKVLEQIAVAPVDGRDWRRQLTAFATSFRVIVLAHPNVGTLLAQRPASGFVSAKRAALHHLNSLEEAGFSAAQAVDVMHMVARFVLSIALADAAAIGARPSRAAHDGPELEALLASLNPGESERLFRLSVEIFIKGIEATLPHDGSGRPG